MLGNLDYEVLIERNCQVSGNMGMLLLLQLGVVTSMIHYTGTREHRYN